MGPAAHQDNDKADNKRSVPGAFSLRDPVHTQQKEQIDDYEQDQNGARYVHEVDPISANPEGV